MSFVRRLLCLSVLALSVSSALADFDEDYESSVWTEIEVQLPDSPKPENLLPFYVSAATENKFFVDGSTLKVGSDGVVRYVLLVVSSQGV